MRSKKVKRKKEFQEGSQERPVWNECMQQAHQKAPYRAKVQKFEQGSTIWPGVHPARQGCRDVEKARARTGREQAGKERKGLKVRTRERHQAVEGETRLWRARPGRASGCGEGKLAAHEAKGARGMSAGCLVADGVEVGHAVAGGACQRPPNRISATSSNRPNGRFPRKQTKQVTLLPGPGLRLDGICRRKGDAGDKAR